MSPTADELFIVGVSDCRRIISVGVADCRRMADRNGDVIVQCSEFALMRVELALGEQAQLAAAASNRSEDLTSP
jgi:hypothetical protein